MEERDVKQGRFGIALAVGMAAALLGLTSGPLRADENEAKVRGAITVNTAARTVTVGGTTLAVSDATRIEVNDRLATLAGLAAFVAANPGLNARAEFVTIA